MPWRRVNGRNHSITPHRTPFRWMRLAPHCGPSRTQQNPDDHRRTSDGRWSRYERRLDAVDLTECAGRAARTGAIAEAIIARDRASVDRPRAT